MKFKIGDVVKVIYDPFTSEVIGKLGKIIEHNVEVRGQLYPYKIKFLNNLNFYDTRVFLEEELELKKPILKKFIEEMENADRSK